MGATCGHITSDAGWNLPSPSPQSKHTAQVTITRPLHACTLEHWHSLSAFGIRPLVLVLQGTGCTNPYLVPGATCARANTSSPSSCLPVPKATGEDSQAGLWYPSPVPVCPGSWLDQCQHCDGCLGGLQEAEPFVLSERNHDNHPRLTRLCCLPPPCALPSPFS